MRQHLYTQAYNHNVWHSSLRSCVKQWDKNFYLQVRVHCSQPWVAAQCGALKISHVLVHMWVNLGISLYRLVLPLCCHIMLTFQILPPRLIYFKTTSIVHSTYSTWCSTKKLIRCAALVCLTLFFSLLSGLTWSSFTTPFCVSTVLIG